MKTHLLSRFWSLLAFAAGCFPSLPALAQDSGLDLSIRTTVEQPMQGVLAEHPTFIMAPAVEVASEEKLIRPVPESTLLAVYQLLQRKLEAQGYVGVTGKARPDLVITIQYGRGHLPNPYTIGNTTAPEGVGYGSTPADGKMSGETGRTVMVRGVKDYLRRLEPGYEGRMQAANQEKLFFTIGAWKFTSMQKGQKPERFWTTTIVAADPDHRDLNRIYEQMITAGADYFNRRTEREEAEVTTAIREGRVEVGKPRVVAEPSPAVPPAKPGR